MRERQRDTFPGLAAAGITLLLNLVGALVGVYEQARRGWLCLRHGHDMRPCRVGWRCSRCCHSR